jgi:pimeloyl-ACP methyl ester carboxylesterase
LLCNNHACLQNYLADLTIGFVDVPNVPGAQIHKGFAGVWAVIAGQAVALVQGALAVSHATNVVCVGHSLGGAIATVAAFQLSL